MSLYTLKCKKRVSENWLEKLKTQWKLGKNCDAQLVIGTEKIPIQRCVLAASSSYFQILFTSDFKEKNSIKLDLSDTFDCPETLRKVIGHIYGDEVTISEENVERILRCTDILNLSELTEDCFKFLSQNVQLQNCLWTWALADTFSLKELTEICQDTATSHFQHTISKLEDTMTLPVQHLITFLNQGLAKNVTVAEFKQFINRYIAFDPFNRESHEQNLLGAGEPFEQESHQDGCKVNEDSEEAIVLQGLQTKCWYIYNLKDNCWYTAEHTYKIIEGNSEIVSVGLGPNNESILLFDSDKTIWLLNVKSSQCVSFPLVLEDHPNSKNVMSNMKLFHPCTIDGEVFAIAWFVSTKASENQLLGTLCTYHCFCLYRFELEKQRWKFLKIISESTEKVQDTHCIQTKCKSMHIFLVGTNKIQAYEFSTATQDLSKLKPFIGNIVFRERQEVFAHGNVIIMWNPESKRSLHYNLSQNRWWTTSMQDFSLIPIKNAAGFKKFHLMALSERNGTTYLLCGKNALRHFRTHFVRYDPFMKDVKELYPLPLKDIGQARTHWCVAPKRFFENLQPVNHITLVKDKLLSQDEVDSVVVAYHRRINNLPAPEDDNDDDDDENKGRMPFEIFTQLRRAQEEHMRRVMFRQMLLGGNPFFNPFWP